MPNESGPQPFFMRSGTGQRFCLFHPPVGNCRGAVLYVHPFAEELNRSRRMAALQSRRLAALGYGVLQIDLYGCGDSSGDFGDARWELWKEDLAAGARWLEQRLERPVVLWGLRLGALLALDYARGAPHPVGAMILWQPVLKGPAYLTQFLRLRTANAMLGNTSENAGTDALRALLKAGHTVEIAGYDLAPELALAIDVLDPAEDMAPPAGCPVHWFEALGPSARGMPAGAVRVGNAWRERDVALQQHALHCPPFWTTAEITECPAWIEATAAALEGGRHAV